MSKTFFPAYDAMWPERFPRPVLETIFDRITSYYRMAQYQQVPSLGDLSYFDVGMMPRYKLLGAIRKVWIAVDAAQTETVSGAYTAFVTLGYCIGNEGDHHLKVLGVRRGRWRPDVMNQQLIDFYEAMRRRYGVYPEAVCVERAAGGYGMLSLPLPIVPVDPKGDKEERAGAVCWLVNKGLVQLPEDAPWLADFVNELENFPLTNHKDQVDAFVHGLAWELRKNVDFDPRMMAGYVHRLPLSEDSLIAEAREELEYRKFMSQWDDITF
jgi:predicted phage terminase large subunit-like protein